MVLLDAFKAEHGSTLCRDVLGYDVLKENELAIIKEKGLFKTLCPKLVESGALILEKKNGRMGSRHAKVIPIL